MKRTDSDLTNLAGQIVGNSHETQQPVNWLKHKELPVADEAVEALLKASFQEWYLGAAKISSPLLCHRIMLLNSDGTVLSEYTHEGDLPGKQEISVPIKTRWNDQTNLALLGLVFDGSECRALYALLQAAAQALAGIFYYKFDLSAVSQIMKQQQISDKEAQGRDILFQVAKRLHDQNDVHSVLNVLLDDVEKLYPHADVNLYLSQDFVNGDARVKPLQLRHSTDDRNAQAFLSGRPVVNADEAGITKLSIPMSGKQAVYGVLSMTINNEHWEDSELRSLGMLSDTAGSAFENAKLFEQSNLLITELQLINELTKRLNQSLRLNEVFEFAMSELLNIFKADYCNLLQLSKDNSNFQIVASNVPAAANEIYSTEYGFCGMVYSSKEPLIISDYWATRAVDSSLMDGTGARSLIAAPVMSGTSVIGVIMVSHRSPNFFSYENFKLLQVLSTHIGLAISNASLHAEVRRMVITDNLTGLHARHYLNEQIQSRQRKDPCGSLVLVDIDHFKRINDTYGHLIGDSILIIVSDVIRSSIRDSDIAARWGGEELAIYLPHIRSAQAYRIAERIRSMVEELTDPAVTVSCGLSEWTFEEEKISVESLFYRADMALYEAKKNGRNRIFIG
ncbi:sensor domain-containing diguanylate cyclase [Paenibacillus sp. R14(2021)]|uniref:sensor domain-containing diguanylate cyclase n=1 Tax=Paenibacillus sp. R14(2021) TaxID=2859228 RepID=UPI001C614415|nr:sensor domain-containing diguanylate cyclase [Paenibacillus sp. R14(2021)]